MKEEAEPKQKPEAHWLQMSFSENPPLQEGRGLNQTRRWQCVRLWRSYKSYGDEKILPTVIAVEPQGVKFCAATSIGKS